MPVLFEAVSGAKMHILRRAVLCLVFKAVLCPNSGCVWCHDARTEASCSTSGI